MLIDVYRLIVVRSDYPLRYDSCDYASHLRLRWACDYLRWMHLMRCSLGCAFAGGSGWLVGLLGRRCHVMCHVRAMSVVV